ncbi:MAG: hypothetical protein H3C34_10500 [Caldilineaceae bacterium]|nr:hypothetical protein [Caldilineaceae bacterium]
MKTPLAARLSALLTVVVTLYAVTVMRPGLRLVGVLFIRQGWLLDNPALWQLGLWLWMVAIFCWMWVLISLLWHYLPAHRISTMLESGLILIGATLSITGTIAWMGALPAALPLTTASELMPIVDGLALGLLGGGCLMSGIATAWVAADLMRLAPLPRRWTAFGLVAGLLMAPTPFLLPFPWHLLVAAAAWTLWCAFLGARRRLPSAYPELG